MGVFWLYFLFVCGCNTSWYTTIYNYRWPILLLTRTSKLNQSSRSFPSQTLFARGWLTLTNTHIHNLTKLWHAWISCVCDFMCDFADYCSYFPIAGMLCILRQKNKTKGLLKTVLVSAKMNGKYCALYFMLLCVCVRVSLVKV